MPEKPQFLIAAPSSDSGKTTITLGLLRALKERGLKVQPFKCGPDYIDPILHHNASGTTSINLDSYMASSGHVKSIYNKYLQNSKIAIVEGVMGMFDGADKMKGSSAEIALLLDIPVILVINAKAMAYSASALIYGFKKFRRGIKLVGVIFNNVNSLSHYSFLKEACYDAQVEPLGYLPTQPDIKIPSRHLGLNFDSSINFNELCDKIAFSISKTVDIDRLLTITTCNANEEPEEVKPEKRTGYKIAVAFDKAFRFIYHQNLEIFEQLGEITFFSPLTDTTLPKCDFLYLPGGYPELFAEQLSENKPMLNSILQYCADEGKTFAECGGMMYLGNFILNQEGKQFKMVNFFPISTSMEQVKLHLGYRSLNIGDLVIRGHEFHYSTCTELESLNKMKCNITNAKGNPISSNIYYKNQTIASYNHLYWGEQKEFIEKLFQNAFCHQ